MEFFFSERACVFAVYGSRTFHLIIFFAFCKFFKYILVPCFFYINLYKTEIMTEYKYKYLQRILCVMIFTAFPVF